MKGWCNPAFVGISYLSVLASGELLLEARQPDPPRVTSAPRPRDVLRALAKRQSAAETCGWISSNSQAPVTCPDGQFCARDDTNTVFGCCNDPNGCTFPTTCVDSTLIGRMTDTDITLYCDQKTAPACQYLFDDEAYTSWVCGSTYDSFEVGSAATNQNGIGVTTGADFTTFFPPTSITGTLNLPGPQQTQGFGSSPSSTSHHGGSGSGSANGTNSAATTGSGSTGLSTGAIAGIAVAVAIIGLAAIVIAACFCLRRKKRNPAPAVGGPTYQPATQYQMPLPQPPQPPGPMQQQQPPPPLPSGNPGFADKGTAGSAVFIHPTTGSDVHSMSQPISSVPPSQHPDGRSSVAPSRTHYSASAAGGTGGSAIYEAPTGSVISSAHPSSAASAPLNPQNLNMYLASQEWDGMRPRVPQTASAAGGGGGGAAAAPYMEIYPDGASYQQQQQPPPVQQYQQYPRQQQQQQQPQQPQQQPQGQQYQQYRSSEEYDGLSHLPELRPQDAAGEPRFANRNSGFLGGQSVIYSVAGRTAIHPASEMQWHQPV